MQEREALLLQIMHYLAERLKTRLALEGGMLLRLLNCPRSTQDVDYVLISTESKKVLAARLKKIIADSGVVTVEEMHVHSRGVFFDVRSVEHSPLQARVEIVVQPSLNLSTESLSTAAVARQHALTGRIVAIVALAEAFANKIAAALERESVRDLYDVSQFEPLCAFDAPTLRKRLATLSIGRKKPQSIIGPKAAEMLRRKGNRLTEAVLERELYYRGSRRPPNRQSLLGPPLTLAVLAG